MQSMARLLGHLEALLRDSEAAVQKRDVSAVLHLLGKLEPIGALIRRQEEINRRQEEVDGTLTALKQGLAAPALPDTRMNEGSTTEEDSGISSKGRGDNRRLNFVRTLRTMGIPLEPVKGQVFRTGHGTRVGIAPASESNNRWFLGLPENGFDHAVLLCYGCNGKLTHFSLPKEFIDKHSQTLSRKNGQLKFNVRRRGEEFLLLVPRRGPVSIEAYRDNFTGLTESS